MIDLGLHDVVKVTLDAPYIGSETPNQRFGIFIADAGNGVPVIATRSLDPAVEYFSQLLNR